MMKVVAVVALLAAAVLAGEDSANFDLSFNGNLSNADVDFKFRATKMDKFDVTVANQGVKGVYWGSASVDVETDAQSGAQAGANADSIVALGTIFDISAFKIQLPPFVVAAYAKGELGASFSFKDFIDFDVQGAITAQDLKSLIVLNAKYKAGVIGLVLVSVDEVDDNGDVQVSYPLHDQGWGEFQSQVVEKEGQKVNLQTTKGKDFSLTFITANVAGILKYANAPVSPRSFEIILANNGLKLKDNKNHFQVKTLLISSENSASVSGNAFIHKTDDQVYAALSGKVEIDGNQVEASVAINDGKLEDLGIEAELIVKVKDYIMTKIFGGVDVKLAKINFPKGKSNFIYDPSVGAGKVVYDAGATAAIAVLPLIALIYCTVSKLL